MDSDSCGLVRRLMVEQPALATMRRPKPVIDPSAPMRGGRDGRFRIGCGLLAKADGAHRRAGRSAGAISP